MKKIGLIGLLNSKVLTVPIAEITVSEKQLKATIYPKLNNGLCIVRIYDGTKIATVLVCLGYIAVYITWANANLYMNSNCKVSGNWDAFSVTITADQISGNEKFVGVCSIVA